MRPLQDNLPIVGQHVELEVAGEACAPVVYATWVQDVQPPRLTVAAPTVQARPVYVPLNMPVRLHYRDDRGVFTMRALVVAMLPEPPLVTVEAQEVSRTQDRKYFRWQANFPVRLVKRTEVPGFAGFDNLPPQTWRWAQTRDISAGGMLLELTSSIEEGDLIMVEVELPGQKVEAEGRVVRVKQEQRGHGGPMHALAGIEFTRICQGDQDRIVGFIFREQARLRKEGRL